MSENQNPDPALVKGTRSSVESYLETLNSAFIDPAPRPPLPPDLGRLRAAGLPTVDDHAFADALARLDERRRALLGMVEADARTWPPEHP